jgi:hypothetical protein
MFDLFSKLPDGRPLWLESSENFEDAKERLQGLARIRPGSYFIYSEKTGEVIERVEDENGQASPGFKRHPPIA